MTDYIGRRVLIDGVAYKPSRPLRAPMRANQPAKPTDNRCDLCRHWEYVHPDDMGVCTASPFRATGFVVSIAQAVLSKSARTANPDKQATSCDTRCEAWAPDGTTKARAVEQARRHSTQQANGVAA